MRWLVLLYGLLGAALATVMILYLPVFLGYFVFPDVWRKPVYSQEIGRRVIPAIDSEIGIAAPDEALKLDIGLLAAFVVPHSLMARRGFKRPWTKLVPQPIERTTYVVVSSLLLAALYWFWSPIMDPIWPAERSGLAGVDPNRRMAIQAIFWAGWVINTLAVASLGGADLLGVRQALAYFRGQPEPSPEFRTPGLYRFVRHPAMLGLLMALWATPVMTLGHALFSVVMSLYIVVGIWLEERDLVAVFGDAYVQYRRKTSMLLPLRWSRRS